MASKSVDQELVMAHGDNGQELTPRNEVEEIRALPVGPGNTVIPASIRHLRGDDPFRLTGIRLKGVDAPMVSWRTVGGKRGTCMIFTEADARDRLWCNLPQKSRVRIVQAFEQFNARAAAGAQ